MVSQYYKNYEASCLLIDAKSLYRPYKMDVSILSDFNTDDLKEMMDLAKKYTGQGSSIEPVTVEAQDYENEDFYVRDLCEGYEYLSTSNSRPFSWATAVIAAAETSLRKEGINDELSLPYLETCLLKNMEVEDRNVTDITIQQFLELYGLMPKNLYDISDKATVCEKNSNNYFFKTEALNDINKSGLMNMIHKGDPVISLMALNLTSLKTIHNDVENIFKGSAYNPSVFGVVYGYSMDNYWSVSLNVVPCENIRLHLPMTADEYDANYAGIAGLAFSVKLDNTCPAGTIPMYLIMNYGENPTTQSYYVYNMIISQSGDELYRESGQAGVSHTYKRLCAISDYHMIRLADSALDSWPAGVSLTVIFGDTKVSLSIHSGKGYKALIHPTKGLVEEINEMSTCSDITTLNAETVKYLTLPVQTECEDYTSTELDLSDFPNLVAFGTYNYNFYKVSSFKAVGMEFLESILLGYRSFENTQDGSFIVSNCPNLRSIYAENRAAASYNYFELSNLPSLEVINFGLNGDSNNFKNAALMLQGNPYFALVSFQISLL